MNDWAVFVPGFGFIERKFRSKGEAIGFLTKKYGEKWQKLGIRFEQSTNKRAYANVFNENN